MDYRNFTDKLVNEFFVSNNIEDEEFFKKLEETIQKSGVQINNEFENLKKENEENFKNVNETKEMYYEKLDQITNLHNNFEYRVDHLSKHHTEKLAYIATLSKNLSEFEKYKKNIVFANRIFECLEILNETEDINNILPDIFTNPDKMLEEGVEIFEAFRQLIDVTGEQYPVFTNNFKTLEQKMKGTIQESIKDFYENNEFNKMEKLMKVTAVLNSDFIINMYVTYIIEQMNLNYLIKSIKNITFEKVSEEMICHIFKLSDEFHSTILEEAKSQFGNPASKIYLIFPESNQKIVMSSMVLQVLKIVNEFRSVMIVEKDKSDEVYVRIIEYIYPSSLKFTKDLKDILAFTNTDLWNNVDQETSLFLRGLEAIYMSKERSLLNQFIKNNFELKLRKIVDIKRQYESKKLTLDLFQCEVFDLIQSTNFSMVSVNSTRTINRYNELIQNKDEKFDLTETFCKVVMDSIKDLLESFCSLVKLLVVEREKHNFDLSEPHYYILSRINFLNNDFQQIFLYDMKDFFKQINFYDEIEETVKLRTNKINLSVDQLFSQLSSFTSGSLNRLLKKIKYKETYNIKKANEYATSEETDKVANFLRPLFKVVAENWPDFFKKKISQLITKIIVDKLIDILKSAKITVQGTKILKADFQKIFKIFAECLDEFFYTQVHEVVFLVEIFTTSDDALDSFIDALKERDSTKKSRVDPELLKILIKKRKALKI